MKLINHEYIKQGLLNHPYNSNPNFLSKINPFYFSEDKKFIAGYYEATKGWFCVEIKNFKQINYIIEGEVEILSKNKKILLKKDDIFIIEPGDKLKWIIRKNYKSYIFIYPVTKYVLEFFESITKNIP